MTGLATTPLGPVTVLGAHILDVLGRPVEAIPPGQGSARLTEIRATAAGTAAGTGVDLAKLGASVFAIGAIGDDLLGDMVIAAMARHGVDTGGLSRKSGVQTSATILPIRGNGERPALHVPGATSLLELADVDLDRVRAQPGAAGRRAGRPRRHRRRGAGAGGRGRPGRGSAGRGGRAPPRPAGRPEQDRRAARRDRLVPAQQRSAARADRPRRPHGRHRRRARPRRRRRGRHLRRRRLRGRLARAAGRRCRCPRSRSTSSTPPAAATGSPPACWPGCWSAPGRSTPRGWASPAARWSPPAWGRTPGSPSLGQVLDFLGRAQPSVADRIAAAAARRARQQAKERVHD